MFCPASRVGVLVEKDANLAPLVGQRERGAAACRKTVAVIQIGALKWLALRVDELAFWASKPRDWLSCLQREPQTGPLPLQGGGPSLHFARYKWPTKAAARARLKPASSHCFPLLLWRPFSLWTPTPTGSRQKWPLDANKPKPRSPFEGEKMELELYSPVMSLTRADRCCLLTLIALDWFWAPF